MIGTIREVARYKELVKNLVSRDLKVKYKSSVLGFLWSLLNPLLMLVVYTFAFQVVMGSQKEDFAFFFIVAYLPWSFFVQSLALSVGAVVDNGGLLKKVYFPREILPLSVVLSNFVQFLLTFVVLVPFFFYFHHTPGPSLATLPLVMLLHIAFTLGVGMVFATLYVYFRDTRHFVEILLNVWFWLTPVVYTLDKLAGKPYAEAVMWLNPMTLFVIAYRAILFESRFPEPMLFAQLAAISVGTLFFGAAVFGRYKMRFAEAV